MSGKAGMTSRKRKTLPARARPGWLKRGDGRSQIYRALHDRLAELGEQYGGLESLSAMERSLIERVIHVEALIGQFEIHMRAGKTVDVQRYLALIDRLHGIGKTLGLKRVAKPTETLHGALAALRAKPAEVGSQ
jgi:hypothetical protein